MNIIIAKVFLYIDHTEYTETQQFVELSVSTIGCQLIQI